MSGIIQADAAPVWTNRVTTSLFQLFLDLTEESVNFVLWRIGTLKTRVSVPLGRSGRSSSESRPLPKLSMEWEEMVWQSSSKE